ncbi:MAG: hypothetical protein IT538_12205 [Variibacter sp.]|nr:hypothetical protein [Variibacter sp.]
MWPQYGEARARPVAPLASGLLLLVVLAPVVATSAVFLTDVPNHIVRSQLIIALAKGVPSSFYFFELHPIPNLPIDVISLLGARILNGAVVVAGLTVVACAGIYLGILHWRRVGARATSLWLGLLIALLLYSMPLSLGRVHDLLGVALLLVCAARLEQHRESTAMEFWLPQLLLVVLMYFCSLSAAILYFAWAFGVVLFDLWQADRSARRAILARNAAGHGSAAAVLALLGLTTFPGFAAEGAGITSWSIHGKVDDVISIGRMFEFPHEYGMPFVFCGILAVMLWSGWLRVGVRAACGLAALAACFLLMPTEVARLGDMRLATAIMAILLSNVTEGAPRMRRLPLSPRLGIAALVALRILGLAATWGPAHALVHAYAAVAVKVPERAAVAFAYPREPRHSFAAWLESWRSARTPLDLVAPAALHLSLDYWHLHMLPFQGRDVLLSNFFLNRTIRAQHGSAFRVGTTPVPWALLPGYLRTDPYDYVISHEDLSDLDVPGKCLCRIAQSGPVRLYHIHKARLGPDGALAICGCSEVADACGAPPPS